MWDIIKNGIILMIYSIVAGTALAYVYLMTTPIIEARKLEASNAARSEVLAGIEGGFEQVPRGEQPRPPLLTHMLRQFPPYVAAERIATGGTPYDVAPPIPFARPSPIESGGETKYPRKALPELMRLLGLSLLHHLGDLG